MSDKQAVTITEKQQSQALSALSAEFVKLFDADKNRLYAYIYAYVMDRNAADDIFQETSMTLWREFEKFEPGSNFKKWANGIAFNRVRHFRQANKKYQLGLSDDFLQEFSDTMAAKTESSHNVSDKWLHLQHCSALLPTSLKNTYHAFYIEKQKAQEIADSSGKSIYAVRKMIHTLRKQLFNCVAKNFGGDKS